MRRLFVLCLLLSVLCGVSACGQTGPLYLPENHPPKSTHITQ